MKWDVRITTKAGDTIRFGGSGMSPEWCKKAISDGVQWFDFIGSGGECTIVKLDAVESIFWTETETKESPCSALSNPTAST